jgi:hypothetical protein
MISATHLKARGCSPPSRAHQTQAVPQRRGPLTCQAISYSRSCLTPCRQTPSATSIARRCAFSTRSAALTGSGGRATPKLGCSFRLSTRSDRRSRNPPRASVCGRAAQRAGSGAWLCLEGHDLRQRIAGCPRHPRHTLERPTRLRAATTRVEPPGPGTSCDNSGAMTLRCAIDTGVSTEHGLEQASKPTSNHRRERSWRCLTQRYDDGGYSGGSLDRPALQQLVNGA